MNLGLVLSTLVILKVQIMFLMKFMTIFRDNGEAMKLSKLPISSWFDVLDWSIFFKEKKLELKDLVWGSS